MAGRRARTGRGWDAAPPRARRSSARSSDDRAAFDPDGLDPDVPDPDGLDPDGVDTEASGGPRRSAEFVPGGGLSARASSGQGERPVRAPVDPYEQAREICLRQLAVRPRTRAELATALAKRGIDDEVSSAVLDRYADVGLIDDAAFAKAWVTSRHHGRGLARRALASELRRRGVEAELVDEALDTLDSDTEAATARALAERKLRSMGSAPPEAVFRRLVAMLARKGYPAGIAFGAVKDALAARGDEVPEGAEDESAQWT